MDHVERHHCNSHCTLEHVIICSRFILSLCLCVWGGGGGGVAYV